jgi:hypothetical protein
VFYDGFKRRKKFAEIGDASSVAIISTNFRKIQNVALVSLGTREKMVHEKNSRDTVPLKGLFPPVFKEHLLE